MKILSNIVWIAFALLMIITGILGLLNPVGVFASLVLFLPWFLLVGAVANVIYYFVLHKKEGKYTNMLLIDALLSVLFAVIFFMQGILLTSISVVFFAAFMAMFKGILGFCYALELKQSKQSWALVCISSILSIILAVIFVVYPEIGGLSIGFILAFMMLMFGITSLCVWAGVRDLYHKQ